MGKKSVKHVSDDEDSLSSDAELQDALASGRLKPGLYEEQVSNKKLLVNKVGLMKIKLDSFMLNLAPLDRLEFVNGQAPLFPEMEAEIQKKVENQSKSPNVSDISNDFKRETGFYRQAQASVVKAVKLVDSLNIPFERPHDYLAEMAKTDEHMQKVRRNIAKRQVITEKVEKVRRIRQQKKEMKIINQNQKIEKQQNKKQIKGELKKLKVKKRETKDSKYGFGGQKRGKKRNTKDSSSFTDVSARKGSKRAGTTKKGAAQLRPGKRRRQQIRNKKNK